MTRRRARRGVQIVTLSPNATAAADVVAWAVLSTAAGYAAHRCDPARLRSDSWITRARAFESGGRFYERRLRITRWKDAVPEAGALFPGGFDKSQLVGRDDAHLERYVVETRRAELTHWALIAASPAFALWNPPWLAGVQVGYALVANLPCITIQRYNRARLERIQASRARRAARSTAQATAQATRGLSSR